MEETGEWIIKENGGNPEVISEVHSNINRARSTIDEVTVKLNDRRRRLETALTERQRVFDTFDDFGKRVVKLDKSLTRAKPVSAEFFVIKDQRASHEVSHYRLVNSHASGNVYDDIVAYSISSRSPKVCHNRHALFCGTESS